ncbi:hypothetical protein AcetOrient_orf01273 [Acetobacter orientalis]|uniref:Uncharacterized protein n=1 Tax=Acetobacter orientalis TaxID=146474 RepID=A0A2Z5ZFC4_9PROT|nr:hypothetical protein AcetOrient_orf01273 [Acetobacter orientalis]
MPEPEALRTPFQEKERWAAWLMLALLQKACGGLQKGQSHASQIARFTMLHGSQSSTAWLWLI